MTQIHQQIITAITEYLEKNPEQRFTQALQNLELFESIEIDSREGKVIFLFDNLDQTDQESLDLIKNSAENNLGVSSSTPF
jgi:hypothetical protein